PRPRHPARRRPPRHPVRRPRRGGSMTGAVRTLVAWVPDWPIVAASVPAGVPAVVVFANRVVACSSRARAEGVVRGLRRREAQGRCPELLVLEHDVGRDARAFEPVVAAVAAFAPRVEVVRSGVAAVETLGPSRYFGGDEALAARVDEAVTSAIATSQPFWQRKSTTSGRFPLPEREGAGTGAGAGADRGRGAGAGAGCRVGVADGTFAAGLAARRGLVVPPGGSAAFLAPFPVAALDRPDLADLLLRLGLRTLGAFAAVPATDVLARFGPDGAVAHRLACGLDERPLTGTEPPPDFAVQVELEPPAERVDTAAFAAKTLADELHRTLATRGLACTRVCIEAETEHGERLARLWRSDGALTPAAMADRVRWQLDGWLHAAAAADRPTGGISLLRLVPDQVVPDDGRQLGFWGGSAEGAARAARALARVQGMLGPEAVVTAVRSGGRHPAERVTLVPWGDAREPARPADRPWPGRLPAPSPATVFVPMLRAEVVGPSGQPVGVSGRGAVTAAPAQVSVDGRRWAPVVAWAGPWPADERWWDTAAHRRRARFQVVAGDTAWLLAVEGGNWWAEASYD
ncbi:MAG TPA: DNA polymerase Y family protein, partial [Acidimicrobiales bacterium]|nr:DNA polymerase Y family protein [Acidimicrobiales bacterium]